MKSSLLYDFSKYRTPSNDGVLFLSSLESSCAQDLWESVGGHWSSNSIQRFRQLSMEKLAKTLDGESQQNYEKAWIEVVRDFHQNCWGEVRLPKKEKPPETEEKRIFWELFSYIWMMIQATLVTKTAIFYFGLKSAQEDSDEGKIYVILAILFSFVSLIWFAYRKSKKTK